jgi:hypothetical protein
MVTIATASPAMSFVEVVEFFVEVAVFLFLSRV